MFIGYWMQLATLLKDSAGVVGYELMNEPWAGDMWLNPTLMIPGVADVERLQPFYDAVQQSIRTVDTSHVLMFAGVTWDDFGVGFQHVPGGIEFTNMSALAYHFYLPPQLSLAGTFKAREADMERLKVAGFLTEFDVSQGGCCTLTYETMDTCDSYLQSWMGWEYKTFDPITGYGPSLWNTDGSFNETIARVMSRSYAQAVAGVTTSMTYAHAQADQSFTLVFGVSSAVTNPVTEIFIHEEYHYPQGYTVTIEPTGAATWSSPATNSVHVTNSDGLPDGYEITVTIRAN